MVFIMLVILIDLMAIGIMIPTLPIWVGQFVQGKDEQAFWYGVISFVFGICAFISGPIFGSLSDRFGRRPVLLLGFLGLGLNFFITGLATSLAMLVIARLFGGGMQANMAVANAYVADITPPQERAAAFGKLGAMFGIGFIVGPVMGGLLGAIDLRYPFFLAGALTVVNAIYGYFVLPESLKPENRQAFSWAKANPVSSLSRLVGLKGTLPLVVASTLVVLAQFILHTSWVLYANFKFGWGPQMVGWSLALVGVMAALTQGVLVKHLVEKWGRRKLALIAVGSGMLAYIGYGLASSGWVLFALICANFLSQASAPALNSLISEAADADEQGRVLGALGSINSLMGAISPLIAAPLLALIAPMKATDLLSGLPFYVCALVQAAALGVLWRAGRSRAIYQKT
jgi:DHA1 family tetracycline resistance protein-like MFS transporter